MKVYKDTIKFLQKTAEKADLSYIKNIYFFLLVMGYISATEKKSDYAFSSVNPDISRMLKNNSYRIENKYRSFRGFSNHILLEYERIPLTVQEKDDLILSMIKKVQDIDFSYLIETDMIYEYTENLTDFFSRTCNLQNSTPPEINNLLTKLIAVEDGSDVCDPFCGLGTSLIKLYKNNDDISMNIFGQERDEKSYFYCIMNMFINGILNFVIKNGDTMSNPRFITGNNSLRKFDLILSDTLGSYDNWSDNFPLNERDEIKDVFDRFIFGIPSKKRGEFAYLLHILHSLKDNGRAFALVPHGILYRGGVDEKVRRSLVEMNVIDAVIGLPENLLSWTKIPLIILVLNRKKDTDKTLFIDGAFKEKYKQTRTINIFQGEDIEKISDCFIGKAEMPGFSRTVSQKEMAYNNYNLSIPLYIQQDKINSNKNIETIKTGISNLQEKLHLVQKKLQDELEELGF